MLRVDFFNCKCIAIIPLGFVIKILYFNSIFLGTHGEKMCYYLFTVPSSAPPFNVTVLNSTAVNVSWQVVNPLFFT